MRHRLTTHALLAAVIILAMAAAVLPCHADSPAQVGILWSTSEGLTPSLLASYSLGDVDGWRFYLDAFGSLALDAGGAGVSAEPPHGFPVLTPLRDALNADRVGVGAHHDFVDNKTALMLYVVYTL